MAVSVALSTHLASALTEAPTIPVMPNSSVCDIAQYNSVYTQDYTPAQQASHLSDFLNVMLGVTVGGTSALNQRIRIRGVDDTNLKVTIDDARQEGALFYHMGDVTIDPDLLKQAKIEIDNYYQYNNFLPLIISIL